MPQTHTPFTHKYMGAMLVLGKTKQIEGGHSRGSIEYDEIHTLERQLKKCALK